MFFGEPTEFSTAERRPPALAACALLLASGLALALPPAGSQAQLRSYRSALRANHSRRIISGSLSAPHYTILAVGYNGRLASSRAQSFRIAAPDSRVTLQLLDSRGHYAGPVVLGGDAGRAIMGVRAPAKLGRIVVAAAKGYAHLAHPLRAGQIDRTRWAFARRGVPIGNGRNLGLVASPGHGGGGGAGGDAARIGIPNELNVAVPGRRILKSLAPAATVKHAAFAAGARAALRAGGLRRAGIGAEAASEGPMTSGTTTPGAPVEGPGPVGASGPSGPSGPSGAAGTAGGGSTPPPPNTRSPWMSQLFLPMDETVNDDAAGTNVSEIDALLQAHLNLKLLGVPAEASLVELNCNGLSFCSRGGSGQAIPEGSGGGPGLGGGTGAIAFPAGSLDPASGFGEVVGPAVPSGLLGNNAGGGHEFSLQPNATSSEIGSGDVVTMLVGEGGATAENPAPIDFVFNTVPAIAAYSDTAGNSGEVSYPDTSKLGTNANPIKLAAGANGDVVMNITLWRPQRQGIAGAAEPPFMDVGHLGYELDYVPPGPATPGAVGGTTAPQCPATSYSNPSGTLSLVAGGSGESSAPPGDGVLIDSAEDQAANAANKIGFTIDLSACMAAKGTASFEVGTRVQFDISANSQSSADHANQIFVVERTR